MTTSLWRKQTLSGWGGTCAATVPTAKPGNQESVERALIEAENLTVFGLGRSYGDEAVPVSNGHGLYLHALDRFLSFDPDNGELVCEAGVTLEEIQTVFLPRGWALPVTPGTAYVTIGGAVANDVHGKNHIRAGTLGKHIQWLDLLIPNGETLRVSRLDLPHIFLATIGGLGLTGIIRRVCLKLAKVPGAVMAVTKHKVKNLDALFEACESIPEQDDHDVVWLDAMARGSSMGRGILERGHFIKGQAKPHKAGPSLPIMFPNIALNPLSIWAFNQFYYHFTAPAKPRTKKQSAMKFFYPLDSIGHWNRMYGSRGFHQFQAVIPRDLAYFGIKKLLESISASHRGSFLVVVKRTGEQGDGLLSFPINGYSLALDFPNRKGTAEFLQKLVGITRDHGGRVYLAKDSILQRGDFEAMYPRHELFKKICRDLDPHQKLSSQMAVRLGLRSTT